MNAEEFRRRFFEGYSNDPANRDKQNKYADALTAANKAAELAPENTQVGTLARREQDRLKQLTGGSTGASNAAPGAKPQTSQPRTTPPQQQQ